MGRTFVLPIVFSRHDFQPLAAEYLPARRIFVGRGFSRDVRAGLRAALQLAEKMP